jgi:hypothetical protein
MQPDKSARRLRPSVDGPPISDALSDTEILQASAFLFTNVWLDDLLQRTLNPRLPQMRNTEGDDIEFTTISYPLKPETGSEAIRLALDAMPNLRPEGEAFWNWIGSQEPVKKQKADSQILVSTLDDGSLVLGSIQLKGRMLVLETNSRQRAERGRDLIGRVLRGLVGEPVMESRTVAQLMEAPPTGQSEKPSSGLSPAEEQAVLEASMDRYYANLLDERVPMLGNMTPRQAAKSAKGRERLVTWLKFLENSAARLGSGPATAQYDVTWLWKELGVLDLRR